MIEPRPDMDWKPTHREMTTAIRKAISEGGEDADAEILAIVADTLLAIDYMVPIEETMSWRRSSKALIEAAARWVRGDQPEEREP